MSQTNVSISPIIENFQAKLMVDSNSTHSLSRNLSFQNSLSSPLSPTIGHESLINKIKKKIENKETWFSLEFFPPKTVNGASNLISKYYI